MSSNLRKILSTADRPDAIRLGQDHESTLSEASTTLNELFCGNEEAIAFWKLLYKIAHFYDDLIDKDRLITDERVHDIMWNLIVDLQQNPFYCANYMWLKPLIVHAMIAYRASVKYEREGDEKGMEIGHVLRYAIGDAMVMAIYLCGGEEHVNRYAPDLYLRLCNDRLGDYLDEIQQGGSDAAE